MIPGLGQPSGHETRSGRLPHDSVLWTGLTALLVVSPLAFGAVEKWAVTVVELTCCLLFLVWAARQVASSELEIRCNPLYGPILAFAAVVVAQVTFALSAYRNATLTEAALYVSYGLLFFVAVHSFSSSKARYRLAITVTVFGGLLAIFALIQNFSNTDKLYWLRQPSSPRSWIFGPYVNHNHYAGLMEMLTPFPLALSLTPRFRGAAKGLLLFAALLMGGSIILSYSRGGTVAFAVQLAFFGAWNLGRHRSRRVALGLVATALLLSLFVFGLGSKQLFLRFGALDDEVRFGVPKDAVRMITEHPLMGWGLGVFPTVYPRFRSFYTSLFVNQAHNDYLQVLVETGFLGFLAVLWFILVLFRAAAHLRRHWDWSPDKSVTLAALVGCIGILIHSFFDFNLHIPANAMWFYALCALATTEIARASSTPPSPSQ